MVQGKIVFVGISFHVLLRLIDNLKEEKVKCIVCC